MTHHKLIGIDIAKNIFQVCAATMRGKELLSKRVSRIKLTEWVVQQPAGT